MKKIIPTTIINVILIVSALILIFTDNLDISLLISSIVVVVNTILAFYLFSQINKSIKEEEELIEKMRMLQNEIKKDIEEFENMISDYDNIEYIV